MGSRWTGGIGIGAAIDQEWNREGSLSAGFHFTGRWPIVLKGLNPHTKERTVMNSRGKVALATILVLAAAFGPVAAQGTTEYFYRYRLDLQSPSTPSDTTPDTFNVPAVSGAEPSQVVMSSAVTVTGFHGMVNISVGGEGNPSVSVGGGPWGTSAQISAGQSFVLRAEASATLSDEQVVTVSVGTGSPVTWEIETRGPDTVADTINIPPASGAVPGDLVESSPVTVNAFDGTLSISAAGDGSPRWRAVRGRRTPRSVPGNPSPSGRLPRRDMARLRPPGSWSRVATP
jgi:hypothetical protein